MQCDASNPEGLKREGGANTIEMGKDENTFYIFYTFYTLIYKDSKVISF